MAEAAAITSIILFLVFMTIGAQKIVYNPTMSHAADRLGVTRAGFRRLGVVELAAGIAVLVGLASAGNALAVVNESGAGVCVLAGLYTLWRQRIARDPWRAMWPTLALVAVCVAEGVVRLTFQAV
ncbi:MAG TPA: DoxX family protein [Acidimicrobiales bacterium]|nr:DoxX family protein [Acidimicrobiales bacterium]